MHCSIEVLFVKKNLDLVTKTEHALCRDSHGVEHNLRSEHAHIECIKR